MRPWGPSSPAASRRAAAPVRESIVESGATKTPDVASMATRHDNLMYAPCRTLPRPTGSNMMRIAASTDNAGAAGASTRGAGAGFGCQCGAIVDEVASRIPRIARASGSSSSAMRSLQDMELWRQVSECELQSLSGDSERGRACNPLSEVMSYCALGLHGSMLSLECSSPIFKLVAYSLQRTDCYVILCDSSTRPGTRPEASTVFATRPSIPQTASFAHIR